MIEYLNALNEGNYLEKNICLSGGISKRSN